MVLLRSFLHRYGIVIGDGVRVDGSTGGKFIGKIIQVRGVTGNLSFSKVSLLLLSCRPESPVVNYLVAQALAGDNGDLIADLLVDLEVQSELGVVALNNDLGGPLDGLRANATHDGEVVVVGESAVVCSRWERSIFGVVGISLPSSLNLSLDNT